MAVLTELELALGVDDILRAQGADPETLRLRSPKVVEAAEEALQTGLGLIEPVIAYRALRVRRITHEKVNLDSGIHLTGKLPTNLLAGAYEAVVMVGTVGSTLESYTSAILPVNTVLGLALDSLGTAAVDALIKAACTYFNAQAVKRGFETTIPFSPGMDGWDFATGQKQLFQIIDPAEAGVQLSSGGMMIPQKSLTAVIGLGEEVSTGGRACDFCSIRATCRYQDQYA